MNFIRKKLILFSLKETVVQVGVFGLFFLPLLYIWMGVPFFINKDLAYVALGGVIPYSDATGYYTGAELFLRIGELNSWNIRRPLNALLFALRLKISGESFQMALLIQTALCGLGTVFFLRTVSKIIGIRGAFISIFICFLWAFSYIPTLLSEPLGFFLGLLAITLLIESIYLEKISLFTIGVFVLTVGLNARAGPFLILLFLFLWMTFSPFFKKRKNWLLALGVGIILGFLYTKVLLLLYAASDAGGQMNSNFSSILYGLARGGLPWTIEYKALEGLGLTTENDQAIWLYKESLRLILENPFNFIKALLLNLGHFSKFFLNIKYIKGFAASSFDQISFIGLPFLLYYYFLSYKSFRRSSEYTKKLNQLALMGGLGCFFSAAFTFDSAGIRTFAVGIPFISLLLAMPFFQSSEVSKKIISNSSCMSSFSLLFLTASLILPSFLVKKDQNFLNKAAFSQNILHTLDEKIIQVCHLENYPFLNIETKRSSIAYPSISPKRFKKVTNRDFPIRNDLQNLALEAPCSLGLIFDELAHQFFLIAGPLGWFNLGKEKETQTLLLKQKRGFDNIYFVQKVFKED
ncbi:MAG: hypothetical protein JSS34_03470 [Proteobacteria bacterium]|nr:hypothetical protein [Pseudomonadota bacterium]